MNPTSTAERQFPRVLEAQHFTGRHFVILLEEIDAEFKNQLEQRDWYEVQNAYYYLQSVSGDGPLNWSLRKKYEYKSAMLKSMAASQYQIPYNDLREILGMPRDPEFARISEVTISLIFPHAMNTLPAESEADLHRQIEERIGEYVKLGQDKLNVVFSNTGKTPDITKASVIVRGVGSSGTPTIAVPTDRPEWKTFVVTVASIGAMAMAICQDRLTYSQLEECV